jgi:archaellum biogenesis ATPase FlaH
MKTEQEIKNMIKKMEILQLDCIKHVDFEMFSYLGLMINILKWAIELDFDGDFLPIFNAIESININK